MGKSTGKSRRRENRNHDRTAGLLSSKKRTTKVIFLPIMWIQKRKPIEQYEAELLGGVVTVKAKGKTDFTRRAGKTAPVAMEAKKN